MEEPKKPVEIPKPSTPHTHTHNNKRKLNNADLQNSSYFKIRAVVRQLRPHFIQVLQTPDFRNCKAAHEIQTQLKLVMDLYKQKTVETDSLGKFVSECEPLSGENVLGKQPHDSSQEGKQPEQSVEKSADNKPLTPPVSSERKLDDGQIRQSYIVGGSVFGWNFITFGGSKPVYYGVKKESFRSSHKKSHNPDIYAHDN